MVFVIHKKWKKAESIRCEECKRKCQADAVSPKQIIHNWRHIKDFPSSAPSSRCPSTKFQTLRHQSLDLRRAGMGHLDLGLGQFESAKGTVTVSLGWYWSDSVNANIGVYKISKPCVMVLACAGGQARRDVCFLIWSHHSPQMPRKNIKPLHLILSWKYAAFLIQAARSCLLCFLISRFCLAPTSVPSTEPISKIYLTLGPNNFCCKIWYV